MSPHAQLPLGLGLADAAQFIEATLRSSTPNIIIEEFQANGDPELAMKREGKAFYQLGRGADSKEGVMAFVEKRPARWSLRPSTDMPDLGPLE